MLADAVERALREHDQDAAAVVLEGAEARSYTRRAFHEMVETLRPQLRSLGVRPGHLVPMALGKTVEAAAATLAVVIEGGVFCHYNARYGEENYRRLLAVHHACPLIVNDEGAQLLPPQAFAELTPVYLTGYRSTPSRLGEELPRLSFTGGGTVLPCRESRPITGPLAGGIRFTSGSSGKVKAILSSSERYLANALSEVELFRSPEDRYLWNGDFAHGFSLNELFATFLSGGALHVFTGFFTHKVDWVQRLQAVVERSGITGIELSASALATLLDDWKPGSPMFPSTSTLRFVITGGSPLPGPLVQRLSQVLGDAVHIHQCYGSAEVGRITCFPRLNAPEHAARSSSAGLPVRGARLFIARDRETLAATGEVGQIAVIDPARTMVRCMDDPGFAEEKISAHAAFPGDQVVYNGDYGYLDADGYLFIVGREDGMFKKRVWLNVYPSAIEAAFLQNVAVAEVVVFGVEVKSAFRVGKTVALVRIRQTGVDREALMDWARKHLSAEQLPDDLRVWEEFPRTNGKLARAQIRARYLAEECPWPSLIGDASTEINDLKRS